MFWLLYHWSAPAGKKVLNSNLMIMARQFNESGLIGPVKILSEK
jgi:hypothetical protein